MQVVKGIVSRLSDDGAEATIVVERAAGCRRCAEGRGCGAGILDTRGRLELTVAVPDAYAGAAVGDRVELGLASSRLLEAAVTAYAIPIVFAAAFAVIADAYAASDAAAAVSAAAGLGLGVWLGRSRLRRRDCVNRLTPKLLPPGNPVS